MRPFYLFLDFDGVLHHDGDDARLFEHAQRLGELLAGYPEVQVVVSSSWRNQHSLGELREVCGPLLGSRLVDVTPVVVQKGVIDEDPPYSRFVEVAYWLEARQTVATNFNALGSALARDDWVAIDDTDFWFPAGCQQLLHVADGTGMLGQHFAELEARLRAFSAEVAHVA